MLCKNRKVGSLVSSVGVGTVPREVYFPQTFSSPGDVQDGITDKLRVTIFTSNVVCFFAFTFVCVSGSVVDDAPKRDAPPGVPSKR